MPRTWWSVTKDPLAGNPCRGCSSFNCPRLRRGVVRFVPEGDDAANATKVDSDSRPRNWHLPRAAQPKPRHPWHLPVCAEPGSDCALSRTGSQGDCHDDRAARTPSPRHLVVFTKGGCNIERRSGNASDMALAGNRRSSVCHTCDVADTADQPVHAVQELCCTRRAKGGRLLVPDCHRARQPGRRTRYRQDSIYGKLCVRQLPGVRAWRRRSSQCPRPSRPGPTFPNPVYRFTTSQCLRLHGLTACPGTSLSYSILVLKVTVPGRSKPVYVSIGLAGNGMVARTILYSLRASPAIGHPLRIAGTIAGTLVRVGGPAPGAPSSRCRGK